tara:strand:+ start:662 stop:877 length:216 start_codon:yes stop_codon:yes gene_type:complete
VFGVFFNAFVRLAAGYENLDKALLKLLGKPTNMALLSLVQLSKKGFLQKIHQYNLSLHYRQPQIDFENTHI